MQFALKRHPELPDVPTAVDLARNDEERAILAAVMNAAEVGTAFFTTPGVPADRLTALRRAFDATMTDADFLADAEKTRLGVSPLHWRRAAEARGRGQQPLARAPGKSARRLHHQGELTRAAQNGSAVNVSTGRSLPRVTMIS